MRDPGREARLVSRLTAGKTLSDLEEREIGEASGLIAGRGPQQAGQQVGAQMAHLRTDRILQPRRLPAAAEDRRRLAVDEAVGHAFVVAERRDPAARLPLAALRRRKDRPRHAGRTSQRPALEPRERGDPCDLLDKIRRTLNVWTPGWRRHLEQVTTFGGGETER